MSAEALLNLSRAISLTGLLASLTIFAYLALTSREAQGGGLRSLKFQLSVSIVIWLIPELLDLLHTAQLYREPVTGLYGPLHLISMAVFAFATVYRYLKVFRGE